MNKVVVAAAAPARIRTGIRIRRPSALTCLTRVHFTPTLSRLVPEATVR